jgi:uncharacterized metal-binding protein YceD (DUF177 family)
MSPEFSRPHRLGTEPKALLLRASAAECRALALRFGILGIDALQASLDLAAEPGGTVRIRGHLLAAVEQACVVTLEPVAQRVAAPIDLRILPEGSEPADDDPDSPDEIESAGGFIDLGEAIAEQLSLALDPYPRAADAALPPGLLDADDAPEAPAAPPHPFASLTRLKRG